MDTVPDRGIKHEVILFFMHLFSMTLPFYFVFFFQHSHNDIYPSVTMENLCHKKNKNFKVQKPCIQTLPLIGHLISLGLKFLFYNLSIKLSFFKYYSEENVR